MLQRISFTEVPDQGISFEISETAWVPDDQVHQSGPVAASLALTRKGEGKVEARGKLHLDVMLTCDRCLTEFSYNVNALFQVIYEVNDPDHHWHVHEMETSEADLETELLEEGVIDISDLLRQQLLLTLPEKKLCNEKCKGLCSVCGINLNQKKCSCEREVRNSPFSILSQIKTKK